MAIVFAGLCCVAVVVLMVAEIWGHRPLRAVSKTTAALAFVAYGLSLGAASAGAPGLALLAALVCSVIGDICLLSNRVAIFKAGILAFLIAHIGYIAMFYAIGIDWIWMLLGGLAVGVLGGVVARVLTPFVGALRWAVYAYIVVICGMVAAAIGMAALFSGMAAMGLLASAIVFFISDLCVANERFVTPSIWNKMVGLPLYFGAQLGFATFTMQMLG